MIRKFKPSDLEAILELFYDVIHSVGAKYYDQEQINAWVPKEGIDKERWLASLSDHITYVAEVEGKIVGFADMTEKGYIDRMFVHKHFQGKGIARALFKRLEEDARLLELEELTTEASIMAKSLAELQGFKIVEKQHKIHRGIEFINYKMAKKL